MFLKKFFGFLALLAVASTSSAALIEANSSFGTNSITIDTDTGLEWLDPFYGLIGDDGIPQSYNEVADQMDAGERYDGFRFATRSELETLFYVSAGIDSTSSSYSESIGNLIELMGDTFSSFTDPAYKFFATTAYYDDGDDTLVGLASLEATLFMDSTYIDGNEFIVDNNSSPDISANAFGSWLVRTAPVAVSEPNTMLLLLLGFAHIALRRKNKACS